ncbi:hypothetical protein JTB14_011291 [Gonioctena quinquepunctata]|nr:hypothetical protein JTB14_011291 [Gonioctena quinquepunctata]
MKIPEGLKTEPGRVCHLNLWSQTIFEAVESKVDFCTEEINLKQSKDQKTEDKWLPYNVDDLLVLGSEMKRVQEVEDSVVFSSGYKTRYPVQTLCVPCVPVAEIESNRDGITGAESFTSCRTSKKTNSYGNKSHLLLQDSDASLIHSQTVRNVPYNRPSSRR